MATTYRSVLRRASFVLFFSFLPLVGFSSEGKIAICHIPPDDPENVQIIDVSEKAASKHIERHGDLVISSAGEICDGLDNDCDREVDEDFTDLESSCSDGIGACQRQGSRVCAQDGAATVCSAIAGEPTLELCTDGIDNDCDGFVDCGDPDCTFNSSIHDENSDQFNCKNPVCGDGYVDSGEQCDDPTNECCVSCQINEGAVCGADENECTLSRCSNVGACESQDTDGLYCSGNGIDACSLADTCLDGVCQDNGPNESIDLFCNGLDEDCDGMDAQPSGACQTGLPGVCGTGSLGCNHDEGTEACFPDVAPGSTDEVCGDGLDNDCDGAIDEGCGSNAICPCTSRYPNGVEGMIAEWDWSGATCDRFIDVTGQFYYWGSTQINGNLDYIVNAVGAVGLVEPPLCYINHSGLDWSGEENPRRLSLQLTADELEACMSDAAIIRDANPSNCSLD